MIKSNIKYDGGKNGKIGMSKNRWKDGGMSFYLE